jgi:UDP-N-acetylmuramyl pentapeptide phosphotransferase/UDP-N-acetylglucosamine-1-phosphate transferase
VRLTAGDASLGALALAALCAAVAAAVLWLLLRCAARLPLARPGPRSLHATPIPRLGGISIWAGYLPAALAAPPSVPGSRTVWLAAIAFIAAISLRDDFRGVHPAARVASHFAAAIAVAVQIAGAEPRFDAAAWYLAVVVAALAITWAANLYNFMDGSDGLAALMAVCGFAAYGIAAALAGAPAAGYLALAGATLPFLVVNLPPARMFMGDVGAVPLGFLAAACGLAGWRDGTWPAWFPLLVFLPFIADASITLALRIWRRERVWEAHKMHYYQRLHQLGAGHRGTLSVFGALIAGTAASALATLAFAVESGWIVTAAWCVALAALFSAIEYYWQRRIPRPR